MKEKGQMERILKEFPKLWTIGHEWSQQFGNPIKVINAHDTTLVSRGIIVPKPVKHCLDNIFTKIWLDVSLGNDQSFEGVHRVRLDQKIGIAAAIFKTLDSGLRINNIFLLDGIEDGVIIRRDGITFPVVVIRMKAYSGGKDYHSRTSKFLQEQKAAFADFLNQQKEKADIYTNINP